MKKKLRVVETFAGYGSQSLALRNIKANYEVVAISEIDKYAIRAYEALHGEAFNLGDISKISPSDVPDHDLLTYSFPCTDISCAGLQKGCAEGSNTRSGLLWECKKIIAHKKPKFLLMENVKNLIGKNHKPNFDLWCKWLEEQGYKNYWDVLNAKHFGIPQHRERLIMVSVLDDRKVDIKPPYIEGDLQEYLEETGNNKTKPSCVKAFEKEFEDIILSDKELYKCDVKSGYTDCRIGIDVAPTILANNAYTHVVRYNFPSPKELKKTIFDYLEKDVDGKYYMSEKAIEKMKKYAPKGIITEYICPTLTTELAHSSGKNVCPKLCKVLGEYRRLTPRECGRLMGLYDSDIDKMIDAGLSDTQLYKMFGNSIVVQVLEGVFKNFLQEYID